MTTDTSFAAGWTHDGSNNRRLAATVNPVYVIAGWMGHFVKVQRASYAQITEGQFEAFNSHPIPGSKSGNTVGNAGGNKDTRNGAKRPKVATPAAPGSARKNADDQCFSTSNADDLVPEAGLEPARDVTPIGF